MIEIAAFIAAELGYRKLAGISYGRAGAMYAKRQARQLGIGKTGTMNLARRASLRRGFSREMERGVWRSFWSTKGGLGTKFAAAEARAGSLYQSRLGRRASGAMSKFMAGSALGGSLLKIGVAYATWGSLIPMAAEGALGAFEALSDVGREVRTRGPETGTRFFDTRQAATMRMAGLQAMHESGMRGYRNAMGGEAAFFHR